VGRPETAARLFGAAEALYEACRMCMPPPDRPTYEAALARARTMAEKSTWETAWLAGRKLSINEAMAEAYTLAEAATAMTRSGSET
jgi:hypothetical protein